MNQHSSPYTDVVFQQAELVNSKDWWLRNERERGNVFLLDVGIVWQKSYNPHL